MDCNKEEAQRAKEIAEKKFAEKDYKSAKKLAQKAKQMNPELAYISIFITILDIFCRRERTVNDQPNWPAVLGVGPSADIPELCERYWQTSKDIEAVKNNVVGARGAFQLVSEAFCNLSNTFWTKCLSCRYQFLYCKTRINTTLSCFYCRNPFVAVPVASGKHPMHQMSMNHFRNDAYGRKVVLALSAPAAGGKWPVKRSKRMKKTDDCESSTNQTARKDKGKSSTSKMAKQDKGESSTSKTAKQDKGESSTSKTAKQDAEMSLGLKIREMMKHKAKTEISKHLSGF